MDTLKIKIAQVNIQADISENTTKILDILASAQKEEWIIFPEGMLSGYFPKDPDFIKKIDQNKLEKSLDELKKMVIQKGCHLIFGSVWIENKKPFNTSIHINPKGDIKVYHKNNLSTLDRNHFIAGNDLQIFSENGINFGIQMCRENAFPEQWKALKRKGAQIIFHLNNAVEEYDSVRKSLLIARAFENQYYVCSVNRVSKNGPLASLLIAPNGEVIYESVLHEEDVTNHNIDLSKVEDRYLNQERRDLVNLELKV